MNERSATSGIGSEFGRLSPPVILIGMHRSGTSLVAGMLSCLGIYMDPTLSSFLSSHDGLPDSDMRRNGYGEAVRFRLLNEAVMADSVATWDNPAPFLEIRDNPRYAAKQIARLRRAVNGPLAREFFGDSKSSQIAQWGWKDPRNSLTLPYWLAIFPDAKLIHVRRNVEDVAKSLVVRARFERSSSASVGGPGMLKRLEAAARSPRRIARYAMKRIGMPPPPQNAAFDVHSHEEARRLSEFYLRESERAQCLGRPYLELSYEEIVGDPTATTQTLSEFCEAAPSLSQAQRAAQFVSPTLNSATSFDLARKEGSPAFAKAH